MPVAEQTAQLAALDAAPLGAPPLPDPPARRWVAVSVQQRPLASLVLSRPLVRQQHVLVLRQQVRALLTASPYARVPVGVAAVAAQAVAVQPVRHSDSARVCSTARRSPQRLRPLPRLPRANARCASVVRRMWLARRVSLPATRPSLAAA